MLSDDKIMMICVIIAGQPGQRINLTLHDFAVNQNKTVKLGGIKHCHVYAILKERDVGSTGKSSTICGGNRKSKHIYLSSTESVEVRILTRNADKPKYFLIDYECKCYIYVLYFQSIY